MLCAMAKTQSLPIALAAAAALVAAVAGYWAFASWQKRTQHDAIAALVGETSAALKQGLGASPPGDELKRVDAALDRLRAAKAGRQRLFADSAEVYLVSARAVLQRKSEVPGRMRQAEEARRRLVAHMATPRGRSDGWIREAAELKKRMDQSYFDANLALEALAETLRTLPDAGARLVPDVSDNALPEPGLVAAAQQRTQDDLKRIAAEREGAGQLNQAR
jgi:hypothetical protein